MKKMEIVMQPRIVKQYPTGEFPILEGCRILETWNTGADESASIAPAMAAPGATTNRHCLEGIVERYRVSE
jgi:hypothetical protein